MSYKQFYSNINDTDETLTHLLIELREVDRMEEHQKVWDLREQFRKLAYDIMIKGN